LRDGLQYPMQDLAGRLKVRRLGRSLSIHIFGGLKRWLPNWQEDANAGAFAMKWQALLNNWLSAIARIASGNLEVPLGWPWL
jgi:hypothetical protein